MNLNRKIMLVLLAGITLYTIVGFAFNRFLVLPSFHQLEIEEARKDMRRCLAALEGHITQIELLCNDWAAWDDTYAFVETTGEAYIEANLYPSWFIDNDMSIMLFFRSDGTIVWSQYFDRRAGAAAPLPELQERRWEPDHPLVKHTNRDSVVRGVMRTSLGPMLFVSRPILPSEAVEGEVIKGALVMGRLLDDAIVDAIREQTQVSVQVIDLDRQKLPPEAAALSHDEIRIVEESPEILRVLTHTHDYRGRDVLVFDATIPRRIMARGQSAIFMSTLAAGIAAFVFLLMLLSAMKWIVSDPLQRLSAYARGVGPGSAQAPVPLAWRQDEIGQVAREFAHMLDRLKAEEAEVVAAEQALRTSQARTRSILETAPDAIVLIDMAGRVDSANHAASELFASDDASLAGSLAMDWIAPESRMHWQEVLRRAAAAEGGLPGGAEAEMMGLGRQGTLVPIHVRVAITQLEGTPYYTCAMRDISALKAMQEKVARSQHLARIGEMGATVAHEIRNPLAGMKGALQVVAGGTLDADEQRGVLQEIQGLIDRISRTVDQLLRYAKPIEVQASPVPLRDMVESVCAGRSPTIPEGVEVVVDIDTSFVLRADPQLFRQVLENIWGNACQAVRTGGRIVWRASRENGMAEITLFNDGTAIREDDLSRLFEPFFTTRVEGSGLGLSVSQRIVEAHEGTISIENTDDAGVTVVVRLPQGA